MKIHALRAALLVSLFVLPSHAAYAGMDCYVDPVHAYSWSGNISSAVFLRDNACVSGTTILATLPVNAAINIVGFTDGWYYVEYNGARGWVGSQFVTITTQNGEERLWNSYQEFMQANPSRRPSSATPPVTTSATAVTTSDPTLVTKTRGYILLDVQARGEAWYFNPADSRRYYMRDGATAYQMMRSFGMGVFEADYDRMATGNTTLRSRFRGRIILRAQAHGEAYYIHPKTLTLHYLKDGPAAYEVMRYNSLGIASADLSKLAISEVPVK